jgi:hypothetical protein
MNRAEHDVTPDLLKGDVSVGHQKKNSTGANDGIRPKLFRGPELKCGAKCERVANPLFQGRGPKSEKFEKRIETQPKTLNPAGKPNRTLAGYLRGLARIQRSWITRQTS